MAENRQRMDLSVREKGYIQKQLQRRVPPLAVRWVCSPSEHWRCRMVEKKSKSQEDEKNLTKRPLDHVPVPSSHTGASVSSRTFPPFGLPKGEIPDHMQRSFLPRREMRACVYPRSHPVAPYKCSSNKVPRIVL